MIEQAVFKLLTTYTPITAIVGGAVHYAERPQKYALPAIVIQRGPTDDIAHLKGRSGLTTGLVRVTCLAPTYLGVGDLSRLVITRLAAFAGTLELAGPDGEVALRVAYLLVDDRRDIASEHRDGQGEIATHGVQIDFRFAHHDPQTTA